MAHGEQRVTGRQLQRRVRRATAAAINLTLNDLLAASGLIVPLEEGTLAQSGHVIEATEDHLQGEVRYSTPYAARQHEELTYRHLPGRTAKYLEVPFKTMIPTYSRFVADVTRRAVELGDRDILR
jgi:hypothetical protein